MDLTARSPDVVTDDSDAVGRQRDDAFAAIAVLCSVAAAGIATVYWIARIGFDNPVLPVAKALALSIFLTTAPLLVRLLLRLNRRPYRWYTSYSALWLAALAATAFLGAAFTVGGAYAFYVLAASALIGLIVSVSRFLRSRSRLQAIFMAIAAAGFGVWISGVVWGRIYKNPLFFENLAATGVVHHDALFLQALANMLRTYGEASTGLNGLPYIPYHWGTPWMFAQWSNLLDCSLLDFYQLAFPVTMIPFFFGAVLALAAEVRCLRAERTGEGFSHRWWFWPVFLAASIGVLPVEAMDTLAVWTSNLVISESYTVAVPVALLLASTAVLFYRAEGSTFLAGNHRPAPSGIVYLLVVMPVGIVVLGLLKISLMVLAFGVAMYLALRLRFHRRLLGAAAMTLSAVLFVGTYRMVSLPAHNEGLRSLDFLRDYVPERWWIFFPFLQLFWSWVYVAVRLVEERTDTLGRLWSQIRNRQLLDVEAVVLVAIAGIAPALAMRIDGGSAFYFSDVQRWLAVGLLLAIAGRRLDSPKRAVDGAAGSRPAVSRAGLPSLGAIRIRRVAAVALAIPFALTLLRNAAYWPKRFAQENSATRASIYGPMNGSGIPAGIHGLPYLANSEILRDGLRKSRNYTVVNQLRLLGSMSRRERHRTVLFIPQSEHAYWGVLTRPGACSFSSLVAPALSSIAMIDGMPPFGCRLSRFYGLGQYTPRQRPQTAADESVENLCAKALADGFDRVLILRFPAGAVTPPETVACTPPRTSTG